MASTLQPCLGSCISKLSNNNINPNKILPDVLPARIGIARGLGNLGVRNYMHFPQVSLAVAADKWRIFEAKGKEEYQRRVPSKPDKLSRQASLLNSSDILIPLFFDAINTKDREKLDKLLSMDFVLEDENLHFPSKGKQSMIDFLCKVKEAMGKDIELHGEVEEVSESNGNATVKWFLGWKGAKIPFASVHSVFEFKEIDDNVIEYEEIDDNVIGYEEIDDNDISIRKITRVVKPVDPESILKVFKAVSTTIENFPKAAEVMDVIFHLSSELKLVNDKEWFLPLWSFTLLGKKFQLNDDL